MGTKSGDRMMGRLEWQVEEISGEFNSQAVSNTMWVFATMGTQSTGCFKHDVGV
jgi:hypothetical protein